MKKLSLTQKQALLWKHLLDLGIAVSLAFLRKNKSRPEALKELKASLLRQSEGHWQGLYAAMKKIR